ncbi:Na+/H+ antiporter subunit E [Lysobacter sp. H23M47]|uniref:Na+/H+ antiporter subunit E n=1 Tax=Lysobacter sp. H23M47 TaxID=2781024 RepID=UPI00188073EC|nr:Na+/H+ antiporter subunit E [Lysobacter sp. H23M47]QOW24864.1 Na+/H+ antiporter subunit E [Lysobacter sp. H23M47]
MNFRRVLPSLPLTVTVIVFWIIMVADLSLVQWLFAIVLGVVIPLFAARLDREFARIGNVRLVPKMIGVLIWDVIVSNVEVARLVLGRESNITPGFIWLPLDIANIHGIAALTSFITLTPGTVSAALSEDRKYLLIHVLNLKDADEVIAGIKRRYEVPLMEIFP